jgi:CPA2 family monovalent cation:H+ antiporter-2
LANLVFRDILIIFFTAIPVILVLKIVRLPPLIGFILTGALIGPSGLGLIHESQRIEILAEIGVTLLLFSVGLEFSLSAFSNLKTYVLKGGLLQIAGCILMGSLIGMLLGGNFYQVLYLGCVIALSSTAVVLTSLLDRRLQDSLQGRISTGILILQDLAVIPMIVFLPSITLGGKTIEFGVNILWSFGRITLLLGLVYLFIRYLSEPILRRISRAQSRELFLMTVICFALGMAWLTHKIGLSFALGAFLGGLMIAGTEYQIEAFSEIAPFRYAFSIIFFVSIGMLVDLRFLMNHFLTVLLLVLLVPTLKMAVTTGALLLSKAPLRLGLNVGILLGQIGEFSLLLASMGKAAGVLDFAFYQYVLTIATVTMLATPIMTPLAVPLAERIARLPGIRKLSLTSEQEKLQSQVASFSDHVILCGFGPLGSAIAHLLDQHQISYVILELNSETIQRIRALQKNIFFGDGTSEEILFKSGIERARLLVITIPDFFNNVASVKQARRLNPEVAIITRAKYRSEVASLYDAGADIVVSEELEGGIEMGRYALEKLGVPPEEADSYIRKIREFGSADFF